MLKVLANPNAFSEFSSVDPSDTKYLKGIDVIQAGTGLKWM